MQSWLKWVRISLGLGSMLALLGLAQSQSIAFTKVPVVEWNQNDTLELIDYPTVLTWTDGFVKNGSQWPQIDSMEERLRRHPSVYRVEASVGINGKIRIQIDQRDPLLRLIDSLGHQQYLDKTKHLMPAMVGIPARIPIATGLGNLSGLAEDSALLDELMELANQLYSDPFWWIFTDQISLHPTKGFVLNPKIGKHQVVLGKATKLSGKLKKLKLFYMHGLHPADWDAYATIDARFKGQIVCQPYSLPPLQITQPRDSLATADTTSTIPNP